MSGRRGFVSQVFSTAVQYCSEYQREETPLCIFQRPVKVARCCSENQGEETPLCIFQCPVKVARWLKLVIVKQKFKTFQGGGVPSSLGGHQAAG